MKKIITKLAFIILTTLTPALSAAMNETALFDQFTILTANLQPITIRISALNALIQRMETMPKNQRNILIEGEPYERRFMRLNSEKERICSHETSLERNLDRLKLQYRRLTGRDPIIQALMLRIPDHSPAIERLNVNTPRQVSSFMCVLVGRSRRR